MTSFTYAPVSLGSGTGSGISISATMSYSLIPRGDRAGAIYETYTDATGGHTVLDTGSGGGGVYTIVGAKSVAVQGVSATGVVFGTYVDASGSHIFTDTNGTIRTYPSVGLGASVQNIDASGSPYGSYFTGAGSGAFFIVDGAVKTLSYPNGSLTGSIAGVTASGQVYGQSGSSISASGTNVFIADAMGVVTPIPLPDSSSGPENASALGFGSDGKFYWQSLTSQGRLYSYSSDTNSSVLVNIPNATSIYGLGVAADGSLVGNYFSDGGTHAFALRDGAVSSLDVVSASTTFISGVTSTGLPYGTYYDGIVPHGFVGMGNDLKSIDIPGAVNIVISGVDPDKSVWGTFRTSDNIQHNFSGLAPGQSVQTFSLPNNPLSVGSGVADGGHTTYGVALVNSLPQGYVVRDGVITQPQQLGGVANSVAGVDATGNVYVTLSGQNGTFVEKGGVASAFVPNLPTSNFFIDGISPVDDVGVHYFDSNGAHAAVVHGTNVAFTYDFGATVGLNVRGIGAGNSIYGSYTNSSGQHGFILSSTGLRTVDVAGAMGASVAGVKSDGTGYVVYYDTDGGHTKIVSGSSQVDYSITNARNVIVQGVNAGDVTYGTFADAAGVHGFTDAQGSVRFYSLPSLTARVVGVDSAGMLYGSFSDGLNYHSFVSSGGSFAQVDLAGQTNTQIQGVTQDGTVYGFYGTFLDTHGFTATGLTVPAPSTSGSGGGGGGNSPPTADQTPTVSATGGTASPPAGETQTVDAITSGSLTVDGPGKLVLNGTSTYTGPTAVKSGTLSVNGSIVSPVTVESGGTLGGSGSTGTVAIQSGGTLSPGNSPGVLSTKDLSLAAGASLKEELGGTGSGQYDQTKVVGTVALNGATLNLAGYQGFVSKRGDAFTLIDNDGTDAVQGTFAGLAEGGTLTLGTHAYQISYRGGDGNDVVLRDVTLPPAATLALFGSVVTSPASQAGAVYGLYQGLLNRAPDALGLEGFSASLQTGASLTDVASALLGSAERGAQPANPTSFVTGLYANLLHRAPDAGGLQFFTTELAQGVSQATVAVQLATSTEAQANLVTTFQVGVVVPDAIDSAVARLYYGLLNRAPDAGGLGSFEGQVKQAAVAGGYAGALQGLSNVANAMLGSSEFAATHAGQTSAAYVDSLYVGALGRHADAAGASYFGAELAQGVSRATVALQIAQSQEAQVHRVGVIEQGFQLAG